MITYIFYIYKSYFFKFSLTTGGATPPPLLFYPLFIVTMFLFDDLNISQQLTWTLNVNKADNIWLHIPGILKLGECVDFKYFRLMFMTSEFICKEE